MTGALIAAFRDPRAAAAIEAPLGPDDPPIRADWNLGPVAFSLLQDPCASRPRCAGGSVRSPWRRSTEPTTGTDTTKIKTVAVRNGDRYVVNGQKVWISRVQHSDLMILLARTTPLADVRKQNRKACRSSSSTCATRSTTA